MHTAKRVEKFDSSELGVLRSFLTQTDIDPSQASGVLAAFLNGRGYGVNPDLVQDVVLRMDDDLCDADLMQAELERVALVM